MQFHKIAYDILNNDKSWQRMLEANNPSVVSSPVAADGLALLGA